MDKNNQVIKDSKSFSYCLPSVLSRRLINKLADNFIFKFLLSVTFALATGYAAQLRIPLPWTPVPITLQTFVVMLSGLSLGCWWGMFSQVLYLLFGILGVPFFSGMEGGLGVILGARGGYIVGFIFTSFLVGRFVTRAHSFVGTFSITMIIYFTMIYGLGLLQFGLWMFLSTGKSIDTWKLLVMGFVPFVPGGVIKIALASFINRFIPKK